VSKTKVCDFQNQQCASGACNHGPAHAITATYQLKVVAGEVFL